jgi:hypothetical protein
MIEDNLFSFPLPEGIPGRLAQIREEHVTAETYQMPAWSYGAVFTDAHAMLTLNQAMEEKRNPQTDYLKWTRTVSRRGDAKQWLDDHPEDLREQISMMMSDSIQGYHTEVENEWLNMELANNWKKHREGKPLDRMWMSYDDKNIQRQWEGYPYQKTIDLTSESNPEGIQTVFGDVTQGTTQVGSWSDYLNNEGASSLMDILRRQMIMGEGRFTEEMRNAVEFDVLGSSQAYVNQADAELGGYNAMLDFDDYHKRVEERAAQIGEDNSGSIAAWQEREALDSYVDTIMQKVAERNSHMFGRTGVSEPIDVSIEAVMINMQKNGEFPKGFNFPWQTYDTSYVKAAAERMRDTWARPEWDNGTQGDGFIDQIVDQSSQFLRKSLELQGQIDDFKKMARDLGDQRIAENRAEIIRNAEIASYSDDPWQTRYAKTLREGLGRYVTPEQADILMNKVLAFDGSGKLDTSPNGITRRIMELYPNMDDPEVLDEIVYLIENYGEVDMPDQVEGASTLEDIDKQIAELLSPGSMGPNGPALFGELTDDDVKDDIVYFSRMFAGGVTNDKQWQANFGNPIGLASNLDTAATLRKVVKSIANYDKDGKIIIDQALISNIMTSVYGYGSAYPNTTAGERAIYADTIDYTDPRWEQGMKDAIDFALYTAPAIEDSMAELNDPRIGWNKMMVKTFGEYFPEITFETIGDIESLVADVAWGHVDYGVNKNYEILSLYADARKAGANYYTTTEESSAITSRMIGAQHHNATGSATDPGYSIFYSIFHEDGTIMGKEGTKAYQELQAQNMGYVGELWHKTAVDILGQDTANELGYTTQLPSGLFDLTNKTMNFEAIVNPAQAEIVVNFLANAIHHKQLKGDLRVISDLRTYVMDGLMLSDDPGALDFNDPQSSAKRKKIWMGVSSLIYLAQAAKKDPSMRETVYGDILKHQDADTQMMLETIGLWMTTQNDWRSSMDNSWDGVNDPDQFGQWYARQEVLTERLMDLMAGQLSGANIPIDSRSLDPVFGFNTNPVWNDLHLFPGDTSDGWGILWDGDIENYVQDDWSDGDQWTEGSFPRLVANLRKAGIDIPARGDDGGFSDEYLEQTAYKMFEEMDTPFFTDRFKEKLLQDNLAVYGIVRALQIRLADPQVRKLARGFILADALKDDGKMSPLEILTAVDIAHKYTGNKVKVVDVTEEGKAVYMHPNAEGLVSYTKGNKQDTDSLLEKVSQNWTEHTPYREGRASTWITLDPMPDQNILANHPGQTDIRDMNGSFISNPPGYLIGKAFEYGFWLQGQYDNEYEEELDFWRLSRKTDFKNMVTRNFANAEWEVTWNSLGFKSSEEWSAWLLEDVVRPYTESVKEYEERFVGSNTLNIEDVHLGLLDKLLKKIQAGGGKLGNARPDYNLFGISGMLGGEEIDGTGVFKYGNSTNLQMYNMTSEEGADEGDQGWMHLRTNNNLMDGRLADRVRLPWTINDTDLIMEGLPANRGYHPWAGNPVETPLPPRLLDNYKQDNPDTIADNKVGPSYN